MSNLLDKASIILTPTAYNNGEALCVKPSDGSGDFDFSRNSAATRVNAQGLVENVQILSSNLVQNGDFSEEGAEEVSNGSFTNGSTDWVLGTGWSIGTGKALCDGTQTSSSDLTQALSTPSGKSYKITYTISEYTSGSIFVRLNSGNATASQNTVGTFTEYISGEGGTQIILRADNSFIGSITNISVKEVGQNWVFTNVGGSNGWRIANERAICDTDGVNNGRNLNSSTTLVNGKTYKLTLDILQSVDGMNVLVGSTILPNELPTGTNLGYEYYIDASQHSGGLFSIYGGSSDLQEIDNITIIEITDDTNLPRINYEGGCGSWLFEPQATNLFSDSTITIANNGGVVTVNAAISPDGTLNATKINFNTGNNDGGRLKVGGSSATASTEYTISFYAKNVTGDGTFGLRVDTDTQSLLVNKIITVTSEWVRYTETFTTDAAATSFTSNSRVKRGFVNNNEILFYGMQLEVGFATSYIPTEGSSVSRNQDLCTNGGSLASINSTSGTLYFEGSTLVNGGSTRIISLSDGTNNNLIYIRFNAETSRFFGFARGGGGSYTTVLKNGINQTDNNKVALVWDATNFKIWINGSQQATATINSLPIEMNTLNFTSPTGSDVFYGKTKCLAVFPYLTDAELTALTTI